jgi:hypothetical protein
MTRPWTVSASDEVLKFLGIGLLTLVVSMLPIGPSRQRLQLACTMPVAIMSSWIAAGLGFYSVIRYPSRRMRLGFVVAVLTATLAAARFWFAIQ